MLIDDVEIKINAGHGGKKTNPHVIAISIHDAESIKNVEKILNGVKDKK